MKMRLPPEGVQALRDLTGDPEIGAIPLPKSRAPRGKNKEKKPAKPQLNWDAVIPLKAAKFTDKEIAKALDIHLSIFKTLVKLATNDGIFDPEKAKLLTTARMANAMFTAATKGSMPAGWVMLKSLNPTLYFDRMPADPGKKIEKLSDDELEQMLITNPALRKKAIEVEAKQAAKSK